LVLGKTEKRKKKGKTGDQGREGKGKRQHPKPLQGDENLPASVHTVGEEKSANNKGGGGKIAGRKLLLKWGEPGMEFLQEGKRGRRGGPAPIR